MAAPAPPAPVAAAPAAPAPAAAAPAAPAAAAAAPAAPAAPVPCPYTTIPGYVVFKLPTRARDDEVVKVQVKNPTMVKVTFKVGGTKIGRFIVSPQYGFIQPMAMSPMIELQPKKIDKGGLVSYEDKFLIEIAPAPADGVDAEAIWKAGTAVQNPAVLPMDIKVAAD